MEDCIYVFSVAFSGKFDGFSRFFQFFPVFSRFFSDEKFLKKIAKFSRKPVIFFGKPEGFGSFFLQTSANPVFPPLRSRRKVRLAGRKFCQKTVDCTIFSAGHKFESDFIVTHRKGLVKESLAKEGRDYQETQKFFCYHRSTQKG